MSGSEIQSNFYNRDLQQNENEHKITKKNLDASSNLVMYFSFLVFYEPVFVINTLFPLGPGLPFLPSGPLFPFKKVSAISDSH